MTVRSVVVLLLIILISAWLQAAVSSQIILFHGRPDFVLITLICISILIGSIRSALFTVWGGFLTSVLAGINYGSILVSRLITGSIAGLLRHQVIEDSVIVPPVAVFLGTWLSEGLYFVMAPNLHMLRWLLRTVLAESIYNAALSVPIYFSIRLVRFEDQTEQISNPFFERT